jgi:hypothetical protein
VKDVEEEKPEKKKINKNKSRRDPRVLLGG